MIELTYAIGDKAGQRFAVRASAICLYEQATGGAGAIVQIGSQRIAVLESMETLRQKMSGAA